MKKRILALALTFVMAASCVACGGKGKDKNSADNFEEEEVVNTVVVAMSGGFSTLDPGYVYEKYPQVPITACYENLFKFYGDSEPMPCLADTYKFSDDGLTLTVVLKDAKFASGNPVTSADVAFSINRTKNLQGNPSFICDTIESIETPDEKTVVFRLTHPDSAILSKLTYNALAILDSNVVKSNGGTDVDTNIIRDRAQEYLNTTSAGSGMYVMTSYIPDEEIILERNPNYWGEPTNVDKYIIKIQPDANAQMSDLSKGKIDIALNMTDDTMAELIDEEHVEIINSATKTVGFVMMNMNESIGGPVSDPLVQDAIRKALDYEGIQIICGDGTITPYSVIQDGFVESKGERSIDYRNIEEAKELLKEAGYEDGFEIDLTVCDLDMEGILLSDLARKVRDDLELIGIKCNIIVQPWAEGYADAYRYGTLGFTVMYWAVDYNDPNVQLEFLPGYTVGLRAGWQTEMDPELAALYEKAMAATDSAKRTAILEKIQDQMYEDGPYVFFAQAPAHIGYNTRLTGVDISDPYTLDLTLINVIEETPF